MTDSNPPFTTMSGNSFTSEFPDTLSFIEACRRPTTRSLSVCHSQMTSNQDWSGSSSWGEADNLLANGCPDLERTIRGMASEITDAAGSYVQAIELDYDYSGEGVDIGQYLNNEPACFYRAEDTRKVGIRILKIGLNCSMSSSVSARSIQIKGAAFCVLMDALENAGYRCEVRVTQSIRAMGGKGIIRVPVKLAAEPLDLARLAYILAHPSFLRRHMFRFEETMPEPLIAAYRFHTHGQYGMPTSDPDFEADCDLYMGEQAPFNSIDDARKWIKAQIIKFTQPC